MPGGGRPPGCHSGSFLPGACDVLQVGVPEVVECSRRHQHVLGESDYRHSSSIERVSAQARTRTRGQSVLSRSCALRSLDKAEHRPVARNRARSAATSSSLARTSDDFAPGSAIDSSRARGSRGRRDGDVGVVDQNRGSPSGGAATGRPAPRRPPRPGTGDVTASRRCVAQFARPRSNGRAQPRAPSSEPSGTPPA